MSTVLIYLQKDKFEIYSMATAKLYEFRFVPEIIRDLEVMNMELLDNLIKLFLTNSKIPPDNVTIVLSDNACFIKDFFLPPVNLHPALQTPPAPGTQVAAQPTQPTQPNLDELQEKVKSFIEHVPFDNVVSKSINVANGLKVVAVNQNFYEAIQKSFEKLGFKINAVIPGVVFGGNIGTKAVLDIITANSLLQQSDTVREYNLSNQVAFEAVTKQDLENDKHTEEVDEKPAKKSNKRLFMMLGVFAVLIILLIAVYVINNPGK